MTSDVAQLIRDGAVSGRGVLLEDEAKKVLKKYGIPVVAEMRVTDPESAVTAASELGYPVVLKGLGEQMLHKTEMGMVRVGLTDEGQVRSVAKEMVEQGGEDLSALLVQPMVQGRRELVVGLFQDSQFGQVVMLGLGGIFTEALEDVVFRLAPLYEKDAEQMMEELRSKAILGPFRGEKAADGEAIKKVLMGLSALALDYPQVKEVDINPLIVSPKGEVIAVDALVILGGGGEIGKEGSYKRPPVDKKLLGDIFYPDAIAFVGVSGSIGKWGHMLLTNCLSGNYEGQIYLVNPKGGEICGHKVYPTLGDIPGSVDVAVVTIPAKGVPALLPQLKKKGIRGMLLITSGFGETGKEGKAMEKQLVQDAARAGIMILGPNTMGICNPHQRFFCNNAHVHPMPGSTALVCQSGNMGTQLLAFAAQQDIGIRAFSGSGNEAMVTIEDYMEVFELDKKTRTVVLYLESVKDGRRFFESARRVSTKKPVVVLKGGRTEAGGKAASSHTGALASDAKVFDAACRQAGIIQVDQPMELLDLSAVFSSLPLPKGNRVAIMTLGGGWGVIAADLCMENGLVMPELSEDIIKRLDTMLPDYWWEILWISWGRVIQRFQRWPWKNF